MKNLQDLLDQSSARHHQLCPRQVLGVRMGMLAGKVLGLDLPQADKRLYAFVECDGCGAGGIAVATGCWVDRRTLRVMDYGKLAATFVDTQTGQAIRIKPKTGIREGAEKYAYDPSDRWHNQLKAYQVMPDEELFIVQPVQLTLSLEKIISRPGLRVICESCGEEITNEREIFQNGKTLCRTCAGDGYYLPSEQQITRPGSLATALNLNDRQKLHEVHSIPVICIIGKSGVGKTTLMEKLIRELTTRGLDLATIKHHSHPGFEIDTPGKDSWRFAQAGSQQVVIAAPDKYATYWKLAHELSLDEVAAEIHNVDMILVEGYKSANKPSIEVVRAVISHELIGSPEQRIAVAADLPLEVDVPRFHLDDIPGIAGFIENYVLPGSCER